MSCIDPVAGARLDVATAGARTPQSTLTCVPGALLAFASTNLTAAPKHVFLVGVGAGGELRWYRPFGKDAESVVVAPGTLRATLPVAADTADMPQEAGTSLHVLFFDAPVEGSTIERELASAITRGTSLRALDRLPVAAAAQARIDVTWGAGR